jgi:hypothetical protein
MYLARLTVPESDAHTGAVLGDAQRRYRATEAALPAKEAELRALKVAVLDMWLTASGTPDDRLKRSERTGKVVKLCGSAGYSRVDLRAARAKLAGEGT